MQYRSLVRAVAVVAASILLALSLAYDLTYEPAPQIRIKWREGVAPERRAELERRFRIVNPQPFEERLTYDLLDTRRSNIEAIVRERAIYDTDDINQHDFSLPVDYRYGSSWMWIVYRIPVLRTPGVVQGIVVACVTVLVLSTGVLLTQHFGVMMRVHTLRQARRGRA